MEEAELGKIERVRSNSLPSLRKSPKNPTTLILNFFDQQLLEKLINVNEELLLKVEKEVFSDQNSRKKELFSTFKEQAKILKDLLKNIKDPEEALYISFGKTVYASSSNLPTMNNEEGAYESLLGLSNNEMQLSIIVSQQAAIIQKLLAEKALSQKEQRSLMMTDELELQRNTVLEEIEDLKKKLGEKENELKQIDDSLEKMTSEYNIMLLSRQKSRNELKAAIQCMSSTIRQNSVPASPSEHKPDFSHAIPELRQIRIKHLIGTGNFSEVYYGLWIQAPVALKKFKSRRKSQFIKEAIALSSVNHPNVLRLLGVFYASTEDWYLVVEFIPMGSLKKFLQTPKAKQLEFKDRIRLLVQVATGMAYLHSQGILHCDLAARNVLISKESYFYVCKIADFGLAINRNFVETVEQIPVKWSAPEVIEKRQFSQKSDIYSFGIVCWEVESFGQEPFGHLENKEVLAHLKKGKRPMEPLGCSKDFYQLLLSTWDLDYNLRPSFEDLILQFNNIFFKEAQQTLSSSDYTFQSDENPVNHYLE